jgi:hypothetical protein
MPKVTDRHDIRSFDGAPQAGNTIAVWSGFIADLLKKHGPHARLVLDAGANNVGARVEVDRLVREAYKPRPKFKNASLEKFKDMAWKKLPAVEQRKLAGNRVLLSEWEAVINREFYALQQPRRARPASVNLA